MKSTTNIVNVVASTKLAEEFDLPIIESELEGAVYNKKKFPRFVYRVKAPKAAFLIFTSGKVVCTGSKNVEDVRTVITTLAYTLKSIGFEKIDLESGRDEEGIERMIFKEIDNMRDVRVICHYLLFAYCMFFRKKEIAVVQRSLHTSLRECIYRFNAPKTPFLRACIR